MHKKISGLGCGIFWSLRAVSSVALHKLAASVSPVDAALPSPTSQVSVDVGLDIARDLLRDADQYLLEGLKRLCEYTIARAALYLAAQRE